MRRIAKGIQKFVLNNPKPFIIKVNHHGQDFRGQAINEPMQTITAKNGWGIVTPYIAQIGQTGSNGDKAYSAEQPLTTVTSKAEHLLVTPVIACEFGESIGHKVDNPLGTITAGGMGHSKLVAAFLSKYHGETSPSEVRGQDLEESIRTVDTSNRFSVITSHLIKMRGTNIGSLVTEPVHTITAGGLHIGEVRAFLLKYNGKSIGQTIKEPLHTVTTKDRVGLVKVQGQDYQIVDIGMRMLEPKELFAAQGFPADYIIDRDCDGERYSKAAQVARCGNAVPPPLARALVSANLFQIIRGEASGNMASF